MAELACPNLCGVPARPADRFEITDGIGATWTARVNEVNEDQIVMKEVNPTDAAGRRREPHTIPFFRSEWAPWRDIGQIVPVETTTV